MKLTPLNSTALPASTQTAGLLAVVLATTLSATLTRIRN
jgi:hypothetical protein